MWIQSHRPGSEFPDPGSGFPGRGRGGGLRGGGWVTVPPPRPPAPWVRFGAVPLPGGLRGPRMLLLRVRPLPPCGQDPLPPAAPFPDPRTAEVPDNLWSTTDLNKPYVVFFLESGISSFFFCFKPSILWVHRCLLSKGPGRDTFLMLRGTRGGPVTVGRKQEGDTQRCSNREGGRGEVGGGFPPVTLSPWAAGRVAGIQKESPLCLRPTAEGGGGR